MAVNLTSVGSSVGARFNIVSAIPTAVVVVIFGGLALSGAPLEAPSLDLARRRLGDMGVSELGVALLLIVAIGVSFHPFQFRLVQLLEGYWRPSFVGSIALVYGRRRHADRWERIQVLRDEEGCTGVLERWHPGLIDDRRDWAATLEEHYPDSEHRLMPTRLGNILRTAEDRAGDRYGLDAVAAIPYLISVMPPSDVDALDDVRRQLDVTVRFVWTWIFIATLTPGMMLTAPLTWAALPVGAYTLAWVSYRAALEAAVEYGEALIRTVDLYRFDLLEKMHLPLPLDLGQERANNKIIMELLQSPADTWDGAEFEIRYVHP